MRFHFNSIGPINEAELELGTLTVIAGRNNTGKTYLAYTLYGFLKMWDDYSPFRPPFRSQIVDEITGALAAEGQVKYPVTPDTLTRERQAVISQLAESFSLQHLPSVFSSPRSAFPNASLKVYLADELPKDNHTGRVNLPGGTLSLRYDGESIIVADSREDREPDLSEIYDHFVSTLFVRFLFPELSSPPFVLSAERFGISLFYKELDFARNRLVDMLQHIGDEEDGESSSPFILIDKTSNRYSLPISDNITFTRRMEGLQRDGDEESHDRFHECVEDMIGGHYARMEDDIRFISRKESEEEFDIPLHRASSSARGLLDFYSFLRTQTRGEQLLIIDEPESHLDTANQIEMSRLLGRMVGAGMKVLVTTHSDYMIKEINNLIMLASIPDRERVASRLGYREESFIERDLVRAYIAENNGLRECTIDEFGIDMPLFDKTIDDINGVADELVLRLANTGSVK